MHFNSVNIVFPILIALSASTAFHWLSDVVSGAVLGAVIGLALRNRLLRQK